MKIEEIQEELKKRGLYAGEIDGIAGRFTMAGIDTVLRARFNGSNGWQNWTDARRLVAFEQIMMKEEGIEVGLIDGLVGEQTRYARNVREARKKGDTDIETWRDREPKPPQPAPGKPPRWPSQENVPRFYGEVGKNQVSVVMPFPLRIAWEPAKTIRAFSCHRLVHDSMLKIWTNVLDHYGYERLRELRLDMFGGCLNVRRMRGGTAWSMHSWGIAMDVDPDRNQLNFHRDKATLDDPAYKDYWRFVYAEGAIGLGPERNYDWMHFQFATL